MGGVLVRARSTANCQHHDDNSKDRENAVKQKLFALSYGIPEID